MDDYGGHERAVGELTDHLCKAEEGGEKSYFWCGVLGEVGYYSKETREGFSC